MTRAREKLKYWSDRNVAVAADLDAALERIDIQLDKSIDEIEKVSGLMHMQGIPDLGGKLDAELRKLRALRR
jgi:hypothetical protein